jgi:cellobiose-specific phosphotransferase system component IIA
MGNPKLLEAYTAQVRAAECSADCFAQSALSALRDGDAKGAATLLRQAARAADRAHRGQRGWLKEYEAR